MSCLKVKGLPKIPRVTAGTPGGKITSKSSMELSILIPIYKAELHIVERYNILKKILDKLSIEYEIIFCNDASPDSSHIVLAQLAEENHRIRILSNHQNKGLGYSFQRMISSAKSETLIYTDIDLSFDPEKIGEFVTMSERYDVIVASRYAGVSSYIPLERKIASRCYWFFCQIFFDLPLHDIGSSLLLFKKSDVSQISLVANGFGIHIDLHSKLHRVGLRYAEIPVNYDHDIGPESTFHVLKHFFPVCKETFLVWYDLNVHR